MRIILLLALLSPLTGCVSWQNSDPLLNTSAQLHRDQGGCRRQVVQFVPNETMQVPASYRCTGSQRYGSWTASCKPAQVGSAQIIVQQRLNNRIAQQRRLAQKACMQSQGWNLVPRG